MKFEFYRPEEINLSEFSAIVEKLRSDLFELETQPCKKETVCCYVKDLIKHAEPLPHNHRMVFWGLGEPNEMPHDARVEFFYLPTYLVTAFMMKAVQLYPELMGEEGISDVVRRVLKRAMRACTGRDFNGAGVLPLAECVGIFVNAGAERFLESYPDFCPEFTKLFWESKAAIDQG